jgi:F-type H+-transporting ATPase subunit delta
MSIKKYVKALVETTTKEHLETIYNQLSAINAVAKNDKYKLIILSPVISNDKKVEFIVEALKIEDEKTINLLKLLALKNRLAELPALVALLKDTIANLTGNYKGYVYSKEPLSESKIAEIESKLSNKFNKNIKLEQQTADRDGIQVYVDSLNVEIAVYEDDIKEKLIKNIIRAI